MQLLLDTHAFLWWVLDDPALSARARSALSRQSNKCFVSMASCWEMAIKASLGKMKLPRPLAPFLAEQLAVNRFNPIGITLEHVSRVAELPFHHRDPFDRLLAAQALEEELDIVSADSVFGAYGVRRVW